MTYEEAVEVLTEMMVTYAGGRIHESLALAVEALKYRAEVEKYGSELGMAIAHKNECVLLMHHKEPLVT